MLPDASFTLAPCDLQLVDELRRELGCTETLAFVLARRGVSAEEARRLVADDPAADEAQLHDPLLLGDMAAAVERIQYAIEQREPIVVHGDYDADGVCATTLLVEGLEALGAEVSAFLPDRFTNGYGLQVEQVERFARGGARLLIAVDCGITAVEAVAHASDHGLDTIICDHHRPGDVLPAAIIASTRPSDYPFPDLCATAVAGKLVLALGGPSGPAQHELEAIATVADCVSLTGENRALVRRGLRALRATTRPGLRALAEQCGVRTSDIDAEAIAFKLAPRINAVGRVSRSERAYDLLRASEADAAALAAAVDETNKERRSIEAGISAEAVEQVESWTPAQRDARIYVVHGRDWHEGVVGIVASRLVEKYWRPVIVIADGDPARASGRSIDGVDLHAALASCDDVLLRWGGHAQAGGLTIDPSRIDELRERLAAWGAANIGPEQLAPRDRIDAIVPGNELTFELVQELERLAPFGSGWERPRLLAAGACVEETKAVGGDGTHLKCVVRVGEHRVPGIGFGMALLAPDLGPANVVDVALRPSINRFRGVESLQAELDRVYAIAPPTCAASDAIHGWCTAGCGHPTADRVSAEHLLAAASGLVVPEISGADPDALPALEPLLARSTTVDLRHRGIAHDHVAQLIAARATVLVVVADVPRRRELLGTLLVHGRLGDEVQSVLASERCAPLALRARLHRLAASTHESARIVIADHGSLEHVLDGPLSYDVVAIIDPPTTVGARDRLAATPATTALHLLHGAREARFAADSLRTALDVRATLADTYRHLRDSGPASGTALEALLYGSGEHPRSTAAIIHGLQTLLGRGLLEVDGAGLQLRLADTSPHAASTSS
ncbi:MAG: single-stranded-DNA-specific exonuclease RecJ [Thermoleophilia bacterium]|nr:single-stranded-DNA-specific exonuclease RecJ [Thermoleophilia bacterium]